MGTQITGQLFDVNIQTEEQILKIIDKYMDLLLQGKTIVSWGGEGTTVTKQVSLPIDYILSECRLFLKRKNPGKYGYITNSSKQFRY